VEAASKTPATEKIIVRTVEPPWPTVPSLHFSSSSLLLLLLRDHGAFPSKLAIFQPIERLLFQVLQRRWSDGFGRLRRPFPSSFGEMGKAAAATGFKTWQRYGDDAAEIFRLLNLGIIKNGVDQRNASWLEYAERKEDWIGKIYSRTRLNENFNVTFKRYQEWKATGSGTYGFDCSSVC
jgi:hypothetical protein